MRAKINKALDLNKLFSDQVKGKLLKKCLSFPIYGSLKYDGNYSVISKQADSRLQFITSGGLTYQPTSVTEFSSIDVPEGVYIVERIKGLGKLGQRAGCVLTGPKTAQLAKDHSYKVHEYLTLEEYSMGYSNRPFRERRERLNLIPHLDKEVCLLWDNQGQIDALLSNVSKAGYEGLMLKSPDWKWTNTRSRTVDLVKYKKRLTVDLHCIGVTRGEGKYEGMLGALILEDSAGRIVQVGSGLTDRERGPEVKSYIGKVVEIEYEQIMDTYIQPTFVRVREDKTLEEID